MQGTGWDLGGTVQGKQWMVPFCNGDVTTSPDQTRPSSCMFLHMPDLVHLGRSYEAIRQNLSLTTKKSNQTHNYAIETLQISYFACLPLVKFFLKWAIFRSSYFAQQSVLPSSSWKSRRWSRKPKDNAEGISKHCRRVREISCLICFSLIIVYDRKAWGENISIWVGTSRLKLPSHSGCKCWPTKTAAVSGSWQIRGVCWHSPQLPGMTPCQGGVALC